MFDILTNINCILKQFSYAMHCYMKGKQEHEHKINGVMENERRGEG